MTAEDSFIVPFDIHSTDADGHAAGEDLQTAELAEPFVGQWNQLISVTNWEKGRIISDWREALIAAGAEPSQYSDEAWARRVGGVTAPHVGRLRRVYDRFHSTYATYQRLFWTHFLAALDWEDAPLWLEGAAREGWSVAAMREQRWQAHGAVDSQRPTASQIIEVDIDEDVVVPAQGGGRTKDYGDEPPLAVGKTYENPDFGDVEALTPQGAAATRPSEPERAAEPSSGPFAGLAELPEDLSDAIEMLKLAVLRHKTTGWEGTKPDVVKQYLAAIAKLIDG